MSDEWFYYSFRCKVRPNSLYGKLCRFLKAESPEFEELEFTETEMVLEANSAYNMPLVFKRLREIGRSSDGELKNSGRIAIHKLIQRVYFVAQICGLEGELVHIPVISSHQTYDTNNGRNKLVGKLAFESLPEESVEQSSPELTPQNLLHHEDDETFETMFGE